MSKLIKHAVRARDLYDAPAVDADELVYCAEPVEAMRTEALALAKHLHKFPYGHNVDGTLEWRGEITEAAQRFIEEYGDEPG